MDEKALDRLKQNATLATNFIRDHPNSGIKTVEDFHRYTQNNPGTTEAWAQNKKVGVQDLASAFQDAEQLDRISNFRQEEPEKPQKNPFSGASSLLATPLSPFIETDDVKLGQVALTEPSPEVNLYQFVPTEIAADQEFQAELGKIKDPYVEGLKKQNPKISQKEIDEKLGNLEDIFSEQAIQDYNNSAQRADKINRAREHDIYLKDANGNIIGEKVFKDKKGKADPHLDPVYLSYQRQKQVAITAALKKNEADRKNKVKPKYSDADTRRIIEMQYDGHFAALFPEKAAAYAKNYGGLETNIRTLKKAEKKLQKKEEKQEKKETKKTEQTITPTAPGTQKKARDYQREWNNNTLVKAVKKGYDRAKLARKIQNWKTTKLQSIDKQTEGIRKNIQVKRQGLNELNTRLNEWTSPRSLSSKAWNRVGLNRRLGKRFGNSAGKTAAKTASRAASSAAKRAGSRLAQKAASQAIQAGAKALLLNPFSLTVIGIVLGIILVAVVFIVLISGGGGDGSEFSGAPPGGGGQPPINSTPIPGFTLTKSVSVTEILVVGGQQITYTISYTSDGSTPLSSIVIYDTIPQNTTLVEGGISGKYVIDSVQNTISWSLSEPENQSLSSFSFSVLPITTDVIISNSAWATSSSDGSSQVSSDSCGGFYSFTKVEDGQTFTNPKGNFADTDCYYAGNFAQAKNELYNLLRQKDPANADVWFLEVIPSESAYIPNAYRDHEQKPQTPDPNGAWGLFQISSTGLNGKYDNGDVPWREQVENAVNLLKTQGWGYWGRSNL